MGIDLDRFVGQKPGDQLLCPVCLDAAWLPYIACPVHLLCSTCAPEVSGMANPACPKCRQPLPAELTVMPFAKCMLEGFTITCRNVATGCNWTGSISDEGQHATANCLHRLVECALCHQQHTFASTHLHNGLCPEWWLDCPRGGKDCGGVVGSGCFKRKNETKHDARCTMFHCVNFHVCRTRTTKSNMASHENACVALMLDKEEKDDELQIRQREINELKEKVAKLEAEKQDEERQRAAPPPPPVLQPASKTRDFSKYRFGPSSGDQAAPPPKRPRHINSTCSSTSSAAAAAAATQLSRQPAFTPGLFRPATGGSAPPPARKT
ncbi:hypothetical protein JCM6882_006565 [Rhodosporidiobolus microsporus]